MGDHRPFGANTWRQPPGDHLAQQPLGTPFAPLAAATLTQQRGGGRVLCHYLAQPLHDIQSPSSNISRHMGWHSVVTSLTTAGVVATQCTATWSTGRVTPVPTRGGLTWPMWTTRLCLHTILEQDWRVWLRYHILHLVCFSFFLIVWRTALHWTWCSSSLLAPLMPMPSHGHRHAADTRFQTLLLEKA